MVNLGIQLYGGGHQSPFVALFFAAFYGGFSLTRSSIMKTCKHSFAPAANYTALQNNLRNFFVLSCYLHAFGFMFMPEKLCGLYQLPVSTFSNELYVHMGFFMAMAGAIQLSINDAETMRNAYVAYAVASSAVYVLNPTAPLTAAVWILTAVFGIAVFHGVFDKDNKKRR
jgi:hypothetical protein